jgi:quinoprotein glucose dehydrogenase
MSAYCKLVLFVVSCCGLSVAQGQDVNWANYLGSKERNLYSSLDQIDSKNVAKLEVAWTYDTGNEAEYQANNLIVDGVLYTPTATRKVIALDAAAGK